MKPNSKRLKIFEFTITAHFANKICVMLKMLPDIATIAALSIIPHFDHFLQLLIINLLLLNPRYYTRKIPKIHHIIGSCLILSFL